MALPVFADDDYSALQKNYEQLQSQFEQLAGEMSKLQSQITAQETTLDRKIETKLAAQEADYADRVERLEATQANGSLLSGTSGNSSYHIAGYADVGYTDAQDDASSFNTGHFAPIFHYKYKEILMLETEIALGSETNEEGETETETELEYLTLDLFINDYITLVAGKFISPIGQFQQNLHPSWINKLSSAPIGFGADHDGASQATPLADVGVQFRGGIPIKDMRINYALAIGNGPRIIEEHDGEPGEIEGLDTSGTNTDMNGNKSVGGRIGFLPLPNLEIGVSALTATATGTEDISDRDYDVYGMDFYYAPDYLSNLTLRGEYVKTELGAGSASEEDADKKTWEAWYLQASYYIDQYKFEPVLRYGEYEDSHGETKTQWAPGLNYLFSSNIIAKVGYEFNDTNGDEDVSDRFTLQLAYGF